MKICWDNLNDIRYNIKTQKWYKGIGNTTYFYIEECITCKEPYLSQNPKSKYCSNKCHNSHSNPFKKCSEEHKKIISDSMKKFYSNSSNHPPSWKGGYAIKKIPTYDTYSLKLDKYESIRRNEKDDNILEVKCAYCGKWFIPTCQNIVDRIRFIDGKSSWEGRFYCSKECKKECPIHGQVKFPKDFKSATSREVQPELRQQVLERDKWECQICGSNKSLHCHHIDPVISNPIESADIDNCITLCKDCHKKVHKLPKCGLSDLRKCI